MYCAHNTRRPIKASTLSLTVSQSRSFSDNFNNRTEVATVTLQYLLTFSREDVSGQQPRPFAGWLLIARDVLRFGNESPTARFVLKRKRFRAGLGWIPHS